MLALLIFSAIYKPIFPATVIKKSIHFLYFSCIDYFFSSGTESEPKVLQCLLIVLIHYVIKPFVMVHGNLSHFSTHKHCKHLVYSCSFAQSSRFHLICPEVSQGSNGSIE